MGGRHGRPLEKKTGGRDWGGGPAAVLVEEQAEASRRAGRRRAQSTTAAGPLWPPPRTRRHPQRSPAPKSAAPTAPRSPQFADILIPHGDAEPLRFNPVASRRGRRVGATRGSTGRHPWHRPRRRPRRSPAAAAPSASHGDGPGELGPPAPPASHGTGSPPCGNGGGCGGTRRGALELVLARSGALGRCQAKLHTVGHLRPPA